MQCARVAWACKQYLLAVLSHAVRLGTRKDEPKETGKAERASVRKLKPKSKPDKPDAKPGAKLDAKLDAKPDTKVDATDAKSDAKPDVTRTLRTPRSGQSPECQR